MFCQKCGTKLQKGAMFCTVCGYRTEERTALNDSAMHASIPTKVKKENLKLLCMVPLLVVAGVYIVEQLLSIITVWDGWGGLLQDGYFAEHFHWTLVNNMSYTRADVALVAILPVILWIMYYKKSNGGAFLCMGILGSVALFIQLLATLVVSIDSDSIGAVYAGMIPGSYIFVTDGFLMVVSNLCDYLPTIAVIICSFKVSARAKRQSSGETVPETVTDQWQTPVYPSAPVMPHESHMQPETTFERVQVSAREAVKPFPKKSRFCEYCGNELPSDGRFCTNCGKER